MAFTWSELKTKLDKELIQLHDEETVHHREGLRFIRDELYQRTIQRNTKAMVGMTLVIMFATVLNVGLWTWDKFC